MMPGGHGHGVSLLFGWLPLAVQLLTGAVLIASVGRRSPRWLAWRLPALALVGAVFALVIRHEVSADGLASDPAPTMLWFWTALSAASLALVVLGWRGARWPRRALSVLGIPLTLLCAALMLNDWVGYFPTTTAAWSQLTDGPLPDQVEPAQLAQLAGTGASMRTGRLVPVTIPATASHFAHREEYVYLPPAWFLANHPRLPVLMMIGGEFNTPADWIRVGAAVQTVDKFAAANHGLAPVLVFVDSGGSFNNDTECVDGPRGDAADYLTKDVPSYIQSQFATSATPSGWGIVGWSAGGTCAVDLAVMHPELFGTFEDIAGDLGPNTGDRAATVAKLYGGSAAQWARFDPATVITTHAPYRDTAGWFVNSTDTGWGAHTRPRRRAGPPAGARHARNPAAGPSTSTGLGGHPDGADPPGAEALAARTLCAAAGAKGVQCTLHTLSGRHSWQFASAAFSDALPWLTARLDNPMTNRATT
jgi:S-formylglutathione hydrolase FrmB